MEREAGDGIAIILGAFKLSDWSTRAVLVFSGIYGSKVDILVYRVSVLAGICAARSGLW
jgi:hypothetical protein